MDVFNCVVVCGTDVVAQARAAYIDEGGIVAQRISLPGASQELCQRVADAVLAQSLDHVDLPPDVVAVLV
jgi:hypothetical protein